MLPLLKIPWKFQLKKLLSSYDLHLQTAARQMPCHTPDMTDFNNGHNNVIGIIILDLEFKQESFNGDYNCKIINTDDCNGCSMIKLNYFGNGFTSSYLKFDLIQHK